jgi:hypothetical protein
MSTFLHTARTRTLRPGSGLPRPRLTIVPKVAAGAPRIPFAVLVVTVLGGGLIGLLLLNTALQRGAYEVTDLQKTSDALSLRQQNLEGEVASLQSPQRISERAVRLGMVMGDSPAFLSLSTGKVVGKPRAGTTAQRPAIALSGTTATTHEDATPIRRTPPTTGDPAAGYRSKLTPMVPGGTATLSSGAVTVPKKNDPSGHEQGGKPTDTRRTSPDQGRPQDTKNTSNRSQH